MAASTVICVFHADRGHFNFCLPLARRLAACGARCELWTNRECLPWVPTGCFAAVRADLGGSSLLDITRKYKAAASHGDTDAEGAANVREVAAAIFGIPMVPEAEGEPFETSPTNRQGAEALRARLVEPDVGFVVVEKCWGHWARDLALERGLPCLGFMPSYREPFRAAYCPEPICDFDGECVVRNRPQDLDHFHGWPPGAGAYVIADCLVGEAAECGGRRRFGAFLPEGGCDGCGPELLAWLDGADLPPEGRTVTLVALGSQSTLATLAATAEADLLQGALAASPRVLAASPGIPPEGPQELREALEKGRLRLMARVPQWAALCHANVRCFVSHAGANSTHEALATGTAAVPLPFFDDQYHIAARLEALYGYAAAAEAAGEAGYAPLRKAALRASGPGALAQVAAAVRLGLAVPEDRRASLRESVVSEDGAGSAARAIAERMGL